MAIDVVHERRDDAGEVARDEDMVRAIGWQRWWQLRGPFEGVCALAFRAEPGCVDAA